MKLTGGCHCGAVRFEVDGEPLRMMQCHCNACRRQTGTGHAVNAFFKADDVSITGEPASYELFADSGNTRIRKFCPNCGSRLFAGGPNTPGVIGIAVGAFDQTDWFSPQAILYIDERSAWDPIDPELPTHAGMPK